MKWLIFALALWPGVVVAYTGNDLHRDCSQGANGRHEVGCFSYILGVWSGISYGVAIGVYSAHDELNQASGRVITSEHTKVCFPDGIKWPQVIDTVTQFIAANPPRRHEVAEILIVDALREAFPCG